MDARLNDRLNAQARLHEEWVAGGGPERERSFREQQQPALEARWAQVKAEQEAEQKAEQEAKRRKREAEERRNRAEIERAREVDKEWSLREIDKDPRRAEWWKQYQADRIRAAAEAEAKRVAQARQKREAEELARREAEAEELARRLAEERLAARRRAEDERIATERRNREAAEQLARQQGLTHWLARQEGSQGGQHRRRQQDGTRPRPRSRAPVQGLATYGQDRQPTSGHEADLYQRRAMSQHRPPSSSTSNRSQESAEHSVAQDQLRQNRPSTRAAPISRRPGAPPM